MRPTDEEIDLWIAWFIGGMRDPDVSSRVAFADKALREVLKRPAKLIKKHASLEAEKRVAVVVSFFKIQFERATASKSNKALSANDLEDLRKRAEANLASAGVPDDRANVTAKLFLKRLAKSKTLTVEDRMGRRHDNLPIPMVAAIDLASEALRFSFAKVRKITEKYRFPKHAQGKALLLETRPPPKRNE